MSARMLERRTDMSGSHRPLDVDLSVDLQREEARSNDPK